MFRKASYKSTPLNPKYTSLLLPIITGMAKNVRRMCFKTHLEHHCPYPAEWKGNFKENKAEKFELDWLFEQFTPIKKAKSFIITLMYKLLPRQLLGSKKNWKFFNKSLQTFIETAINKRIAPNALTSGYNLGCITWLKFSGKYTQKHQRTVLCKVMSWIFANMVVPIMRN